MSRRVDSVPSSSDWRPPTGAEPPTAKPVPAWVRELVLLMDGAFRIPGPEFRIGLAPILGVLLPGAGDVEEADDAVGLRPPGHPEAHGEPEARHGRGEP